MVEFKMQEIGEVTQSNGKALIEKKADLLNDREHSTGCYIANRNMIFVAGGQDPKSAFTAEKYDITNNKWELIPHKLKDGRNGPGTCLFQQRYIYIFSGFDAACANRNKSIEMYDTV